VVELKDPRRTYVAEDGDGYHWDEGLVAYYSGSDRFGILSKKRAYLLPGSLTLATIADSCVSSHHAIPLQVRINRVKIYVDEQLVRPARSHGR
jgi:hypothetical protein